MEKNPRPNPSGFSRSATGTVHIYSGTRFAPQKNDEDERRKLRDERPLGGEKVQDPLYKRKY